MSQELTKEELEERLAMVTDQIMFCNRMNATENSAKLLADLLQRKDEILRALQERNQSEEKEGATGQPEPRPAYRYPYN